jgi:hypothetical protein
MFMAVISLIPSSVFKEIGSLLLLIGLSGEVAVAVVKISRKRLEKSLAVVFALLVLIGVGLEYWADRPRQIDETRLVEALKIFPNTPFDFSVELDPESVALMQSIGRALDKAGWKQQPASGGGYTVPGRPSAGIIVWQGIEMQITDSRQADWGELGKPGSTLWHALQREGLTTAAKHVPDGQETPSAIHIKIGAKP